MALGIPYLILPLTASIDIATLGYKNTIGRLMSTNKPKYTDPYKYSVSAIVPAYNEEESIEATIRSLYNQTLRPRNVIVIDDCSTDRTPEICRRLQDELEGFIYVRRDRNSGKAANINYVVKELEESLGDITYINDSDCIAAENCIENLARNFNSDNVAAVTAYGYNTPPNSFFARALHHGKAWNNSIFKLKKRAQGYRSAIFVVCGASTAYRTEVLNEIPMPERTKTEDTDHTWLLQEKGYKVAYDENAIAYSSDLESAFGLCRQWFRWNSGIFQTTYVHGKEILKAKSLFWTTILPGLIESVPYSATIVALPVITGLELAPGTDVPLFSMDYLKGFGLMDFALTVIPTVIISPKYLLRLPQIYLFRAVGSALTLGAFFKTTYEKFTGKQERWSNAWARGHGFESDSIQRITRKYMRRNLDSFYLLENNWTDIGEQSWDKDNFFMNLPGKWDLSFAAEDNDSVVGYITGSRVNKKRAAVNKILVDQGKRSKGLGRQLIRRFEEECRKRGVFEVELKALVENEPANRFYIQLGYRQTGSVEGTDGKMRFVYEKRLDDRPEDGIDGTTRIIREPASDAEELLTCLYTETPTGNEEM